MLGPALALTIALASPAPCRVPQHEAAVLESFAHGSVGEADLAIFDLADAKQVCEIRFPGGPAPAVAIAADGTIYAAIEPHNMTEYTTDMGHLAVFSPDGRLIHRVYEGMQGIWGVQLDDRGRLFVETTDSGFVEGASVQVPRTFTMYDAKSLEKIRSFALGERWFDATVSRDGRYLAVSYDLKRDSGRVDVIDPSSGNVVRQISLPAENLHFEGSKLYVGSQVGTSVVALPNGAPQPAPKRNEDSPVIIDGVAYTEHLGPFVMPGQGIQTTTYDRRKIAGGRRLPPIVAHGIADFPIVRTPSADAVAATPGPEVAPPAFPSVATLERTYASAHAIAFDDIARGRHYTYIGDLARIDIPDKNVFVLVDCAAGAAIIASTKQQTYATLSIDPAPTVKWSPQPSQMMGTAAPLMWRIQPVGANQLHSADAKLGYRIDDASGISHAPLPTELGEREYAMTDASYPSCSTRTYGGGEPLPVEPQRLFDLSDTASRMLRDPIPTLHIDGSPPTLGPGAILVYAEGVQPDGTIKVAVDVKNLHTVDAAEALKQFSLPTGYTQQFEPQF